MLTGHFVSVALIDGVRVMRDTRDNLLDEIEQRCLAVERSMQRSCAALRAAVEEKSAALMAQMQILVERKSAATVAGNLKPVDIRRVRACGPWTRTRSWLQTLVACTGRPRHDPRR